MKLTLRVWRQTGPDARGDFVTYEVDGANEEMSFVELLDLLNERLIATNSEPIAFESDCREGICGACGLMINGQPHGPQRGTATCQLHLRRFNDGDEIVVEPFRSAGFPLVKVLVVDRSAFDRIIESGGFITAPTGSAPDANLIPVPKDDADRAMDAAACIGCGACVAACPNGAGLTQAMSEITALHEEYVRDVRVLGDGESLNQSLEKAGRVSDFFELAELMCRDALHREESCGGHFRSEHQTPDGEAMRNDDEFSYVAAWEYGGKLHKEPLTFQSVRPTQRSYA